jgi:hypothetical protein
VEVPAIHAPIHTPAVSLPKPVDDGTWTFDEKGVPICQYGKTPYFAMETDGTSTAKAGKKTEDDTVMSDWKALRDMYGAELHRLDSRGSGFVADPSCVECSRHDNVRFRCMDCLSNDMLCSTCTLNIHDCLPLHHIQVYSFVFPCYLS